MMAWFVTHNKGLMFGGAARQRGSSYSLLISRKTVEESIYSGGKIVVHHCRAYRFFRFFPDVDIVDLGGVFCNVGSLPVEIF